MTEEKNLHDVRREYHRAELSENTAANDPFVQFAGWFDDATTGGILEPTAMVLSTVNEAGQPSSRVVLLKSFDGNGFVFFTNYLSKKGHHLEDNPNCSLLFFWDKLERQIRIEGKARRVSEELSEQYFDSRPIDSRISAIASPQSKIIDAKEVLETKMEEIKKSGQWSRPDHWGGYVVEPVYFEFWQGRPNRLHDRLTYQQHEGAWQLARLAP